MSIISTVRSTVETAKQVFQYAWQERNWFILPVLVLLILFGFLIFFAQSSPFAPFIYTLF